MDTLSLDGELSIYRAAELKDLLLGAVAKAEGALEIDLGGVTELDTSGVQVLMLAKQVAQQRGLELRLQRHSTAVLEVFEMLNLAGHFGDPLVIAHPS